MIKKAEILVEVFDEGITTRWNDGNGVEPATKSLATEGDEAECIGNELWRDINGILEETETDKVLIKVEYMAVKE